MRKIFTITILVLSMSVLGQIPTNGLVGYWPFNGNANDESGNGSNGVVNGATLTTDRFGNTNKAYNFNGSTDFIRIDNFNSVNLGTSDFTFSCWIKAVTVNNGGSAIFSKSSETPLEFKTIVLSGTNGIGFDSYGKCYNVINNLISTQQWYHVVCVCVQSAKTNNFFINNVEHNLNQDPIAPLVPDQNSDVTFIGKTVYGYFFNGIIDDIRIYNRVLTQQEISALYNENYTSEVLTPNSKFKIKVYPNPAKDLIIIDCGTDISTYDYTLKITNTLGESVLTAPITQQKTYVELKNRNKNGVYIVNIFDSKNRIVEAIKFLIY